MFQASERTVLHQMGNLQVKWSLQTRLPLLLGRKIESFRNGIREIRKSKTYTLKLKSNDVMGQI